MCPADERDHPMSAGGHLRPGGGTYPVHPAASTPHQTQPPPERPPRPAPRPIAPHAPARASPRGLLTVILIGIGVVTLVLLALAVSGYLPDAGPSAEPGSEEPLEPAD